MLTFDSVTVAQECVDAFNELKLGKKVRYIIYKMSDDYTQVVVEDKAPVQDDAKAEWDDFRQKLLNAKAVHKGKESKGPRYAIYDFEYELDAGEGKRYDTLPSPTGLLLGKFLANGEHGRLIAGHAGQSFLSLRGRQTKAQAFSYESPTLIPSIFMISHQENENADDKTSPK